MCPMFPSCIQLKIRGHTVGASNTANIFGCWIGLEIV